MPFSFKYTVLAAVLLPALLFGGCSGRGADEPAVPEQISSTVEVADPQRAVEEIYASLPDYEAEWISQYRTEDDLGVPEGNIEELYGKISDANDGLNDVVIILPAQGSREDVHLALSKYKEKRMDEFEDYDILDAFSIAQNAVIYDQGDYVILLMLADIDAGRAIIDKYMPK